MRFLDWSAWNHNCQLRFWEPDSLRLGVHEKDVPLFKFREQCFLTTTTTPPPPSHFRALDLGMYSPCVSLGYSSLSHFIGGEPEVQRA